MADEEGRFLFANPAAETTLGIVEVATDTRTPIDGWYLPDQVTMMTPEQLPLVRAIRGEKVIDELVFLRNSQEPAGLWIRVNAWPLKDQAARISGGVVMFHDFTQGREALQSILLLSQVVEQTTDCVVLTDQQGIIQYVNPAFEVTTGYPRNEVLGLTPRVLKSGLHDAEFYRQMWAQLTQGLAFEGMVINRKKNGELYWAQQTITPMQDESDHLTHFVSVSQDITDLRKKQEQEFQLQLARDVQQRFYAAAPTVPGFDIGASAHPADETGGDYFDFITMVDGSLIIAVADVKGHGFSAALVMALTRAYLRCFAAMQLELDDILVRVNQMLLHDLEPGHFVTVSLVRLHPLHRTLSYAGAGHVPGFVLLESGKVKCALDSYGPPLGLFPDSKFSLQPLISLAPGEVAVLLTDGVTESTTPDGDQFGSQRVLDYIQGHIHEPARQIVQGIYHATRAFVKGNFQDDDITSVIIKVDRCP
ncbi:MAG TPA: SpoIIE family protein phosphatase [Ktedonobacteraceae bacterium]